MKTPIQMVKSLNEYKEIHSLLSRFKRMGDRYSQGVCYLTGLSEGLRDVLCASLIYDREDFSKERECALVICPEEKTAYSAKSAFCAMGLATEVFPIRDYNFYNINATSHEWEYERLRVLRLVMSGSLDAVIAVPEAALGVLSPADGMTCGKTLKTGDEMSMDSLCETLMSYGYSRCDAVEGQGQFASRGDILDVFVPDYENPVRLEFFGDEIDAMGYFDVMTQRRVENAAAISVTPIREQMPDSEALTRISERIEKLLSLAKKKKNTEALERLEKEKRDLENGTLSNLDKYLPLMYNSFSCLFDYAKGPCFVCDYPRVKDRLNAYLWQLNEDLVALAESGDADIKDAVFCLDTEGLKTKLMSRPCVATDNFSSTPDIDLSGYFEIASKHTSMLVTNPEVLSEDLQGYVKAGYRILMAVGGVMQGADIENILRDRNVPCVVAERIVFDEMQKGFVYITPFEKAENLRGFDCPKARFVLLCDGQSDEGRSKKASVGKLKTSKSGAKNRLTSYLDLTVGDFVVHDVHGIGIYEGIKTLTVGGITRDYITLKYQGSDSLYVPCDQLDKVSKFSGKSEGVRVSKLGSGDWTKTKARVKKAAKDIAKELISLYAERTRRPGYAFGVDTDWQREFEERFEYEETDGQLEAIKEIKEDMERPCPMDRLLCGDVGFGKTEVALRAAFKAVMDGKQVAILVPTTVLCWQHYRTIISRMHGYPIKIEMLSRYTQSKAKKICERLKIGDVDIVVGTHKLLAKGVEFKDLGLLIVDEEQRFGVTHKERLKEMSKQVDVLTLSATPIPRTFNMALVGIRDMSVLEEAPVDRHPVQTYVLEHDMSVIGEAIKKELRRAGQVFYLHNKVEDIDEVAAKIHAIVPDAVVAVAHGKMSQEQLSEAWKDVVEGKTDVLVCTTIIETGVDVPNANTLIIEDADRLGLSQLHQLRGRVGRSSRRAYAYFTWRRDRSINETAVKRLTAIREFTEFGSGFKIAMRDLEIRGAGNLLGAEQSGHMESVGYDMFIKILEQAVLEEKGEALPEITECTVDLKVNAFIPEKYIKRPSDRIEMYKRIAAIKDSEDADDVKDELLDRYGDIPKETNALINIALIRRRCEKIGIVKIEERQGVLAIYPKEAPTREIATGFVSKFAGRVLISMGKDPCFNIKMKAGESVTPLLAEIFKIYSYNQGE
ncbi:MAG: transcription-repair coupling factor [Ruminococcaceae bacterium]|nr:transcription-repair coupling factor [Oscillospiraceae bacterium]